MDNAIVLTGCLTLRGRRDRSRKELRSWELNRFIHWLKSHLRLASLAQLTPKA